MDSHAPAAHTAASLRETVRALERALTRTPSSPELLEQLAEARWRLHDREGARAAATRALAADGSRPAAHDLLGRDAMERGALDESLVHFAAALRARPDHAGTLVNVAAALQRAGDPESAAQAATAALALEPTSVAARLNLGLALKNLGQRDAADDAWREAGDHPMARFNRGFLRAGEGRLAEAWPLLEARVPLLGLGRGLGRPWDGTPLDGTLLVTAEQGLGDSILMSRFLPAAAARARSLVVQVAPPLERLFARTFPGVQVVTSTDGVAHDAWVPIMSLAYRLGVLTLADVPLDPWIAPATAVAPSPRPRVGINWAGNPRYAQDAARSTSLETFAELLSEPGVEWVSLHRGAREHEADAFGLAQPLRDARDFEDTASVIAGLDLVISTETAVPNLSAAMGVATIVMTTPDPDWRWSGWYRHVVVAAQESWRDWREPTEIAADCVRGLVEWAAGAAAAPGSAA